MDSTEQFLAKYLVDGKLPPPQEVDPNRIQLMNDHLNKIEEEERITIDRISHIRFVG